MNKPEWDEIDLETIDAETYFHWEDLTCAIRRDNKLTERQKNTYVQAVIYIFHHTYASYYDNKNAYDVIENDTDSIIAHINRVSVCCRETLIKTMLVIIDLFDLSNAVKIIIQEELGKLNEEKRIEKERKKAEKEKKC